MQSSALSSEPEVCTYPFLDPVPPDENYPEMIALYIGGPNPAQGFATGSTGNRLSCLGGNFQTGMPLTWQFARDSIFLEDLEW